MTGFVAELENCFVEFNGVVSLGDDHARASGRHIIGVEKQFIIENILRK